MELIDTHCHLYLEEFSHDLPEVMARATDVGVSRIYMPSLDSAHVEKILALQSTFNGRCYSMLGLHPCYVRDNYREELDFMNKAVEARQFSAIGEIGLDYYWDRSWDDQQMIVFKEQIALARLHGLPIVIHSRSSMDACIQVLKEEKSKGLTGIFHCFSGSYENATEIIDGGLALGIGGVVTYKNAGLAEVVARLPLEHLVLETDAPYLSPAPFRGKRNESSYLKYIADKIAALKNISVEEVAAVTTATAKRILASDETE